MSKAGPHRVNRTDSCLWKTVFFSLLTGAPGLDHRPILGVKSEWILWLIRRATWVSIESSARRGLRGTQTTFNRLVGAGASADRQASTLQRPHQRYVAGARNPKDEWQSVEWILAYRKELSWWRFKLRLCNTIIMRQCTATAWLIPMPAVHNRLQGGLPVN